MGIFDEDPSLLNACFPNLYDENGKEIKDQKSEEEINNDISSETLRAGTNKIIEQFFFSEIIKIYPENPEKTLKSARDYINTLTESEGNEVLEMMVDSDIYNKKIDAFIKPFEVPGKIIFGCLLNRLKANVIEYNKIHKGRGNKKNFSVVAKEFFPNLSLDQREDLMAAARILNYDGLEKYYICGIYIIIAIVKLIESEILNISVNGNLVDPIVESLKKLGDQKYISEEDCVKNAKFIICRYTILSNYNIDDDLFFEIYKVSDKPNIRFFNKIKKYSQIPNIGKLYLEEYLKNDLNTEKTYNHFDKMLDELNISHQKKEPEKTGKQQIEEIINGMLESDNQKNINSNLENNKIINLNDRDATPTIDKFIQPAIAYNNIQKDSSLSISEIKGNDALADNTEKQNFDIRTVNPAIINDTISKAENKQYGSFRGLLAGIIDFLEGNKDYEFNDYEKGLALEVIKLLNERIK